MGMANTWGATGQVRSSDAWTLEFFVTMSPPALLSVKVSISIPPMLCQAPKEVLCAQYQAQFRSYAHIAPCKPALELSLLLLPWLVVHTELAGSGIAVFGMDAHGHGRSEPSGEDERALVHDFSHLVRPVSVLCTFIWHGLVTCAKRSYLDVLTFQYVLSA